MKFKYVKLSPKYYFLPIPTETMTLFVVSNHNSIVYNLIGPDIFWTEIEFSGHSDPIGISWSTNFTSRFQQLHSCFRSGDVKT